MKPSLFVPRLVGTASSLETLAHCARLPQARRQFDLVEARMDHIPEALHAQCLKLCGKIEKTGTPVIFTLRAENKWKKGDVARLPAFQAALEYVSHIDVEIESGIARQVSAAAHRLRKRVIVSYHNYQATPGRQSLRGAVRQSRAKGADLVKIATLIKTDADRWALMELLRSSPAGKLCVIGMGAQGVALRAFLPVLGSCLAYAHLDTQMAPGQISADELCWLLRLFSPAFNEQYIRRTGTLEMA